MRLLLYGCGLKGTRSFREGGMGELREYLEVVKAKNPEWKHYEIENNEGEIIERGTVFDFGPEYKAVKAVMGKS